MYRFAHAIAISAFLGLTPMANASINPTPDMHDDVNFNDNISLTFTAPVDPERSEVEIFGASEPIPTGTLEYGADRTNLLIPVSDKLPPGLYIVQFTAYSTLGQPVTGTSAITVPERPSLTRCIELPSAADATSR